MRERARDAGIVLILVSTLLVLLVGVGLVMVRAARAGRWHGAATVDTVRARLLACSGIERAREERRAGSDAAYGGEDWNADGILTGGTVETTAQRFQPAVLNVADCPLGDALRPSFAAADGTWVSLGRRAPNRTTVDGVERGYSGRLRAAQIDVPGTRGGTYALRTRGGGIHVNGGDPAVPYDPTRDDYNKVLRRILGTLAEAIDRQDGADDGAPVDEADGWALVELRPASGWMSSGDIRDVALGGSVAKEAALAPHLALRSWADPRVVVPNVDPATVGKGYFSWGEIKLDRRVGAGGLRAPDFERIGGRIVGRAPVDLAWARRNRQVLVALMAGLRGVYFESSTGPMEQRIGFQREAGIGNTWTAGDDCDVAISAILASTSPLESWSQWDALCDTIPFAGATAAEIQAKRDILKANFNPNTRLNEFNPDRSVWRSVDKGDLLERSTEFSLFPVQGVEVESLGRVIGADGGLLASGAVSVSFGGPSVVRLSTQREFVCSDLGDPFRFGDESGVRLPGEPTFVSLGQGAERTWGHTLAAVGGSGAAIQSYPESCIEGAGGAFAMTPADYDGRIALATIETPAGEIYGVSAPVNVLMSLARYDTGMDLDVAGGAASLLPDVQHAYGADAANSLLHAAKPGTLYPDGCYSEVERTPAYLDAGNADGFHGVLSFWAKSNDLVLTRRGRRLLKWSNYRTGTAWTESTDQFFALVHVREWRPGLPPVRFVAQYEVGSPAMDDGNEHCYETSDAQSSACHVWRLVTLFWDLNAAAPDDVGELVIDSGEQEGRGSSDTYGGATGAPPESLTRGDLYGEHRIVLGNIRAPWPAEQSMGGITGNMKVGADTTYDEFAIWNFGGAPPNGAADPLTLSSPHILASARWRDGRYYRGSAYVPVSLSPGLPVPDEAPHWFSAPMRLPAGTVVREVHWTATRPAALPADFVEIEFADEAGTNYLWSEAASRSTGGAAGWPVDAQRWRVGRAVMEPTRVRAVFRREPALWPDAPILDAPALDDLTLLCEPPGGAAIAAWRGP